MQLAAVALADDNSVVAEPLPECAVNVVFDEILGSVMPSKADVADGQEHGTKSEPKPPDPAMVLAMLRRHVQREARLRAD